MSGLFGGSKAPAPQPLPAPKPPAPMPDAESPAVLEAKRRERMAAASRAGRASTILTAPKDRGGSAGGDYSAATLGNG